MRIREFDFRGHASKTDVPSRQERRNDATSLTKTSGAKGKLLDANDFAIVVAATPLVAIDLIVRDSSGHVLLGLRRNPPAQGCWFVPGGRIFKNESLDDAFRRIARDELGIDVVRSQSRLVGAFEHFYDTNFLDEPGSDTHYVVLAHAVDVAFRLMNPPRLQHTQYVWLHESAVVRHPDVHPYTKAYFPSE